MKRNIFLVLTMILLAIINQLNYSQDIERPKLVVGIVVDQMRFDFLYKYLPYYSKGGFRRLMNEGSNFTFAQYNYEGTKTAPGHASVYTGTTPYYNGIIANDWYDRVTKKNVNSVRDLNYKSVGCIDGEGQASPNKLLSTTITDQLKLATNKKSKVISIALKDRGAILPGGHMPDGVYWYNMKTGDFVTSSYYMNSLPKWVNEFNKKKLSDKYLIDGWKLFLPEDKYSISAPDQTSSESDKFNEGHTTFPHTFEKVEIKDRYTVLPYTPFGNDLVTELSKEALINEKLGKGTWTDFLAISFSSTDFIGHEYGTESYEIQDAYLRLDASIEDLLNTLDKTIGNGNYLLFLTADHAGLDTPSILMKNHMPTGGLINKSFKDSIKSFVTITFKNENLLEDISNKQIYFSRSEIKKSGLDIHTLQQRTADFIRDQFPVVASIFTRDQLEGSLPSRNPVNPVLNNFHPAISGDVFFTLQPGYMSNFQGTGTNHGTHYSYDTHVPVIFYGWNIPTQTINTPVYIVDIAATIADLLKISEPSASIGIPIIINKK